MHGLKEQMIAMNLEFIARFVPLGQAQLATFGGKGVEARIWQEHGVPHDNGWLIERNRESGGHLIRARLYRAHNELRTLPDILAGYGSKHAIIDGFHLDLCGTMTDEAIADFSPILPLVFKSKGRCLAITVSDARRNLILERWPDFEARGLKMFGACMRSIYKKFASVQKMIPTNPDAPAHFVPFDPEKATKREFGLLILMAELLGSHGCSWMPTTIERYVYLSRYSGRSCRMRTYLFHFDRKKLSRPEAALARLWTRSRLQFANIETEGFRDIFAPSNLTTRKVNPRKTQGDSTMSTGTTPKPTKPKPPVSKLKALVELVGGDFKAEYDNLAGNSERLDALMALVNKHGTTPATPEDAEKKNRVGRPPGQKNRKTWDILTPREKVELQIKSLECKAGSNGEWKKGRKQFIRENFGYYNAAISGSTRAHMSRAGGHGFQADFRSRIESAFGIEAGPVLERYTKALAAL